MGASAGLDEVLASLDGADSLSPDSDTSAWSWVTPVTTCVPRRASYTRRTSAIGPIPPSVTASAAPVVSSEAPPRYGVAPIAAVGPLVANQWVDPAAVTPVLRFGPAVLVAAQDLLYAVMEEYRPLHRRDSTAHCVVSWLVGLGLSVQQAQFHLTKCHRRQLLELLTACGMSSVVLGQSRILEQVCRALVAANFLCADYPALVPPGLRGRLPFRLPANGGAPSLKRRRGWSDL